MTVAGVQAGSDEKSAAEYGDAVAMYLAFVMSRCCDFWTTLATWSPAPKNEIVGHAFTRQTVSMTWDYGEINPFSNSGGNLTGHINLVAKTIDRLSAKEDVHGYAEQRDASTPFKEARIFSTDPPYYDNIGYADLSDYFYVWLRRALGEVFPDLFATLLVPKAEELIAATHRHGGRDEAEAFFLEGMIRVLGSIASSSHASFPATVYYAFKQSDTKKDGTASTGWETFVSAVIEAGLTITGTWPIRTERSGRTRDLGSNALATSIVLTLRPRSPDAEAVSRRDFLRGLRTELPLALDLMIGGGLGRAPIAPVDLAQAAIGPGMAIYSRHSKVLEADGSPMSVRTALVHINAAVDEYFTEAEGEMDADTRFCVDWFQTHGFGTGKFGEADVLARAKGTAVDGVVEAGVINAAKGDVRLITVDDYPADWDPETDTRTPVWEACHHLCRMLDSSEAAAGRLLARMPARADAIRQLAYRLFTICERKGWAKDAGRYNALITSWPAIVDHSREVGHVGEQLDLV